MFASTYHDPGDVIPKATVKKKNDTLKSSKLKVYKDQSKMRYTSFYK